jgi:hypothetical protein
MRYWQINILILSSFNDILWSGALFMCED